ncbi:MAG: flagellar hook-basal body complex protein [Clostridia bacterium]|jgi:flagellar hook protein FlgE|nr:flagellar hook-basal body complex protein [Clostridia bacterium]MDI9512444.1 flagellar hook-basal body complex protein [Bacillota bacterium]
MIRSMYSGVSGMRNNQTKMDVIGNNIANVSTTAFKSGRVRFQDMFSQTISSAQGPTATGRGGVNPQQIGQGVTIAAIDTLFEPGSLQPTDRDLDLAIEGEGFFIVSEDRAGLVQRYTRDGAFFKDTEGNLTTSSGLRVLGYGITGGGRYTQDVSDIVVGTSLVNMVIPELIDVGGNEHKLEAFSIDSAGLISAVYDNGELYYLGRLAIAKFNNTGALQKLGGNAYTSTTNSGPAQTGGAAEEGFGIIRQGNLEMSNVDLANEFTEMIVTSRAYQANARIITTSDEMLQELVNLKR